MTNREKLKRLNAEKKKLPLDHPIEDPIPEAVKNGDVASLVPGGPLNKQIQVKSDRFQEFCRKPCNKSAVSQ